MDRKGIWVSLIVLLAAGLAPAAWAESHEEEAPAAPAAPTFLYVWTEHVPIADAAAYEEAVRGVLAKMAETEAGRKLDYVALASPGVYHYVIPMAGLGEFAQKNQEFMAATMAAGGLDVWDASLALVDHGSGQILVARPDLSYTPAEPRQAETTGTYRHHEWWYVRPGHELELENVARRVAALYGEKNADTGFRIYQAVTGEELPLYLVTFTAADAADYWTNEKRLDALLGEEVQALVGEAAGLARRLERTSAVMRPDLAMGM